jgi:hypothetical protein
MDRSQFNVDLIVEYKKRYPSLLHKTSEFAYLLVQNILYHTIMIHDIMLVQNGDDNMSGKGKDESVFRMLQSERDRCAIVIEKINRELEKLPKGSIGQRRVKSHGKKYFYPCLKYRNGSVVKFEHLSSEKAEELRPLLEKRKKLQDDLRANKKRLSTINAILQKGGK